MESLIGKKAKGFKFSGYPTHVFGMEVYDGLVGKIIYSDTRTAQIKFSSGKSWNYPYPEILDHLVEEELEEEQSIEQILNNIKNLTKDL